MNACELTRFQWAIAAVIILAGTCFRGWGVIGTPLEFWADEAWWIANTVDRALSLASIRPLGFQWLSQRLISSTDLELSLRLPSLIAGIGVMACMAVAARRLVSSGWLVLVALMIVAVHPQLIVFAKEFKPYSIEAFLHVAFIAWALECLRRRSAGLGFALAPAAALPFCYNLLFLYPGLLLTLYQIRSGGRYWALTRALTRRHMLLLAVLTVLVLSVAHFTVAEALGVSDRRQFWSAKYGVFPPGQGFLRTVAWYLDATWSMITMPANPSVFGGLVAPIARCAFGLAWVAGAVALARTRPVEMLLLVGPLGFALLANLLGYWPYGAFRTNLFLIPASTLVATVGLQLLLTRQRTVAVMLVIVIVVAMAPWNPSYFHHKRITDGAAAPELTRVLVPVLRSAAMEPTVEQIVVADWHSWRPLQHYFKRGFSRVAGLGELGARVTLVRGPVDDADALVAQVLSHLDEADSRDAYIRIWLVVCKLRTMAPALDDRRLRRYVVDTVAYPTPDPDYYPIVVELATAR